MIIGVVTEINPDGSFIVSFGEVNVRYFPYEGGQLVAGLTYVDVDLSTIPEPPVLGEWVICGLDTTSVHSQKGYINPGVWAHLIPEGNKGIATIRHFQFQVQNWYITANLNPRGTYDISDYPREIIWQGTDINDKKLQKVLILGLHDVQQWSIYGWWYENRLSLLLPCGWVECPDPRKYPPDVVQKQQETIPV